MISLWKFSAYNDQFDIDATVTKVKEVSQGRYELTWNLLRHAPTTSLTDSETKMFRSLAEAVLHFRGVAKKALFDPSKVEFKPADG